MMKVILLKKSFPSITNVLFLVVIVQSLSCVWLFVIPWIAAHQASLSSTISWSLLKLMSIESVMPSNHLSLCHPLLLLPSIFPSNRVFSNELALCIRWPKYWKATVLPMNIQGWFPLGLPGLISLLSKGLKHLQHYNLKASVLWCSVFFTVRLSSIHDYWETIFLTLWTSSAKCLLFFYD